MSRYGENERRSGARNVRLAILLGVVAFLVYAGFFVVRALHG